jgi:hypothetical protein
MEVIEYWKFGIEYASCIALLLLAQPQSIGTVFHDGALFSVVLAKSLQF